MADKSEIEWTDATWNPFRGCSRISPGCQNCYAEHMAARGLPGLSSPLTGEQFAIMTPSGPRWTGAVELIENQINIPLRWRRPRRIFVNSMSDTFHEGVPTQWIKDIYAVMNLASRHTYQVLTKRSRRMLVHFIGRVNPTHVHLGVSCEDQPRFDARIDDLRLTAAAVRWLSLEPLLGPIDLAGRLNGIHWVVVGGESGPGARQCNVRWIRSIVRQCREAGVPVFVKQLGAVPVVEACRQHHYDFGEEIGRKARFTALDKIHESTGLWRVHFADRKGGDPAEWPMDLRVREICEAHHG